ncbi:hypothetical protein PBRA_008504, partial [Plasmodiophora brassicae]
ASLPDRVAYVLGELEGDGPARLLSAPILHREISFIVAGAVNDLDLPADARDTLFANAVRYGYAQDLYANIRRSDTAAALISWLCDHAQHDASSSGTLFQLASLSELDARRVRRVACRHMHLADVVLRVSCDIVGDEHVYLASILTDRSHPTVVAMRGDPGLLARVLPAIRERLQTADANIALRLVLQVLATVPIDLDRDLVAAAASANASCDEALCFMLACPQAPVSLGNCPRSLLFQRVTLFALVDERDELGKALSDAVSITVRPLASQIDAVYGALVATESSSGSLCAFSHPSLFHYALLHRKVSPTAHPRELRHFIVQTLPGVALPVHPVWMPALKELAEQSVARETLYLGADDIAAMLGAIGGDGLRPLQHDREVAVLSLVAYYVLCHADAVRRRGVDRVPQYSRTVLASAPLEALAHRPDTPAPLLTLLATHHPELCDPVRAPGPTNVKAVGVDCVAAVLDRIRAGADGIDSGRFRRMWRSWRPIVGGLRFYCTTIASIVGRHVSVTTLCRHPSAAVRLERNAHLAVLLDALGVFLDHNGDPSHEVAVVARALALDQHEFVDRRLRRRPSLFDALLPRLSLGDVQRVVGNVPALEDAVESLPALLSDPDMDAQVRAIWLTAHLSTRYPSDRAHRICRLIIAERFADDTVDTVAPHVDVLRACLPALVLMAQAFPDLAADLLRLCGLLRPPAQTDRDLAHRVDSAAVTVIRGAAR